MIEFFNEYAEKHEHPDHPGDLMEETESSIHIWGPLVVFSIAVFPLGFMLYELGDLIPLLVRITTTEEMIDDEAVCAVLRIMKSRRALRKCYKRRTVHSRVMESNCSLTFLYLCHVSPLF